MRGILEVMSAAATLVEALAPLRADPARAGILLDIDGTLAPIVRHADDAHVPEPTRAQLIAVAKRYGVVGCISGRQAAGRAPDRLARHDRLRRQPRLRAAARRAAATSRSIPRSPSTSRPCAASRTRPTRRSCSACACGPRTSTRSPPSTGAARPTRPPPRRRCAPSPSGPRREGLYIHWGRKVLEIRPPVEIHKGRGVRRLLGGQRPRGRRSTSATTRPTSTPSTACTRSSRRASSGRRSASGVRSDETPPELEEAADVLVDGPIGVRELLTALLA